MKKFYEAPVVELTGFSAEDVITTSVIDPTPVTVDTSNFADAAQKEQFLADMGSYNAGVYDYKNYTW